MQMTGAEFWAPVDSETDAMLAAGSIARRQ